MTARTTACRCPLPGWGECLDRRLCGCASFLRGWPSLAICLCVLLLPIATYRIACADDAVQEPESSEIEDTPDLPDDSELLDREYLGRTLRQWRVVLKNLDHTNPSAIPEIPGLIEIMQDDELPWFTRRQVALTLARIGEPAARAIPLIVEHLASDDAETVNWAAKAIALYGPIGAPAASALRIILEDESQTHAERLMAMEALARIGPVEPNVLPALIAQLQSTATAGDGLERKIAACDALVLLRSGASPALPYLIRLLQSDSSRLRTSATVTIGTIGPGRVPRSTRWSMSFCSMSPPRHAMQRRHLSAASALQQCPPC